MLNYVRAALMVLGAGSPLLVWAQPISGGCFTDWAAATILVKAEGLATVEQLTKSAPTKLGGDIVRTALCESKTGYVYKLVVRNASGQLKNVVLDAKHPFGP